MSRLGAGVAGVAALLALAACAAANSGAERARRALPVSEASRGLAVRVGLRYLTSHSVGVVVHLAAVRSLPVVRVDASSPGHALAITQGCTFEPLEPPKSAAAPRPARPLPGVPLCSLVLEAAASGRYPLDVRIRDAAGHDLVAPIHTVIRIGSKP